MRASRFLPLFATLLVACASEVAPDEASAPDSEASVEGTGAAFARLAVVYTNNIDGEIEPCG